MKKIDAPEKIDARLHYATLIFSPEKIDAPA